MASGQATPLRLSLRVRLQGELHSLFLSPSTFTCSQQFVRKQEKRKMDTGPIPSHSEAGESRALRGAQGYLLLRKAHPHLPGAAGAARGIHRSGERSDGAWDPRKCTNQEGQTPVSIFTPAETGTLQANLVIVTRVTVRNAVFQGATLSPGPRFQLGKGDSAWGEASPEERPAPQPHDLVWCPS